MQVLQEIYPHITSPQHKVPIRFPNMPELKFFPEKLTLQQNIHPPDHQPQVVWHVYLAQDLDKHVLLAGLLNLHSVCSLTSPQVFMV